MTEYSGAYHLFDNPIFPLRTVPQGQTARGCARSRKHLLAGSLIAMPVDCSRGPIHVSSEVTVGYDAGAHAAAVRDVTAVLKQVFGLK